MYKNNCCGNNGPIIPNNMVIELVKKHGLKGEPGRDGSFTQKAYKTYASMVADKENIPANTSVLVNNDPDKNKNAYYTYDGVTFTKSDFDPQGILSTVDVKLNKAIESASDYFESQVLDTITSVTNNGNTIFTKEVLKTKSELVDSTNKAVSNVLLNTTQTVENAIRDVAIDANLISDALMTTVPIAGTQGSVRTQKDKNREHVSILDFFTRDERTLLAQQETTKDYYFDASRPLQEFADYISANDVGTARCSGDFYTTKGIVFGGENGTKTKNVEGYFQLTAINTLPEVIDDLLSFYTGTDFTWSGGICVQGSTGRALEYDRRKVLNGIRIGGKHKATHTKLCPILALNGFKNWGVILDNTTTGTIIEKIRVGRSGSGYLTPAYVCHEETGFTVSETIDGATTQRSVLSVTNLIDFSKIEGILYAYIDNKLYFIYRNEIDYTTSKVSIYPQLPSGTVSGTLMYVYGGGFLTRGGDASVTNIGSINASTTSMAVSLEALYPPVINSITTQSNFMALNIGGTISAGIVGGSIAEQYFETNTFDIVQATKYPSNLTIGNNVGVKLSKCLAMSNYRESTGELFNRFGLTIELTSNSKKLSPIESSIIGTLDFDMSSPSTDYHLRGGRSKTINIILPNLDAFRLFNKRTRTIYIYDGATNKVGDVVVNAPIGMTINGKSSVTISGYIDVLRLDIHIDDESKLSMGVMGTKSALENQITYDPLSLDAATQRSKVVSLLGANIGDIATVSFDQPLLGTRMWAEVTAKNQVTVYHRNDTTESVDVATGNLKVKII